MGDCWAMNKIVLIGSRGVGKSTLLSKIKEIVPDINTYDLDQVIENNKNQSVDDIFKTKGESVFREYEIEAFNHIVKENRNNVVIAVGGGFLGEIPQDFEVIWLRRNEDPRTSYYLDRPQLDSTEYGLSQERFLERNDRYAKAATRVLILREGIKNNYSHEIDFIFKKFNLTSYNNNLFITLKHNLLHESFWTFTRDCEVLVELRSDMFSMSEIENIISSNPKQKFLLSLRSNELPPKKMNLEFVDWAGELGKPPKELEYDIYSWHGDEPPEINGEGKFIKWSPLVTSFKDLIKGHNWWLKDKNLRSFLPRSKNGTLSWYRQLLFKKQRINFMRLDEGSCLDQPTFLDWADSAHINKHFAAVIGDPVSLSHSPAFHQEFFQKRGAAFFNINISKEEFSLQVMSFLFDLGLRWCAITSPLKSELGKCFGRSSLVPLNTLVWNENRWETFNTDEIGFSTQIAKLPLNLKAESKVVVWGGGGILPSIKSVLPKASFYSAQQGVPREGESVVELPRVLVWASSKDTLDKIPTSWKPELIVDVNYHKNSFARVLALRLGCQYQSGEIMFANQAKAQQKFWEKFDGRQ